MNTAADGLSPRVFLRPIGSPLSLGMCGLGIASLVQSGYDLHWVARDQAVKVGLILVAVPFVLQGIASVLAYLARDGAAGSGLGVLATTWLAVGLLHLNSPGGHRSGALGLHAAGIVGLVVVGAAAYCVLAFELEGQQRRPVLPTFRRGRGRAAVLGGPEVGMDDVLHDPGVRQTT